ncbi:glycosyltransferase (plasmid) [Tundrisphaera lichenicola]|uniref:glycosyltransferase n=1 Tax=Tundrisphaera lichenicola TaxID=2029860 RepID=UPI003EBDCD74
MNDVTRRPTICQVLHTLNVGGAEVLAARMARSLRDEFHFVFACLDELGTLGEELRSEGISVEVLGRRPGLDGGCAVRLASMIRRERVDLVHAHQYTPYFYAALARRLCWGPAVLFTEHGRHFPDYPRRKRMLANRFLLARRDRVIGVGGSVREALIRNEGIPAGRIEVIYNGIDLAPFAAGTGRESARRELGFGLDDLVIFMVARLDRLKDHATAVRALDRVAARRPDVQLCLIGDGPERESIRQEVDRRGLGGRVHLLGMRTDVPRLLPAADILLLTSISEGIPLTIIEGMAAGLPVVATRVGGVCEVVDDGVTGLLAAAEDADALAAAILRLAVDPELRHRLGRSGRERAVALFSEDRMNRAYRRIYKEAALGRAG